MECQVLDVVLAHREKILQSKEIVLRKDYCWLFEAYNQREIGMLTQLINKHKMKIDTGPINKEGTLDTVIPEEALVNRNDICMIKLTLIG